MTGRLVTALERKIAFCSNSESPKRIPYTSVNTIYPNSLYETKQNKKPLEVRFHENIQKAITGARQTLTTSNVKILPRRLISNPVFVKESP